MRIRKVIIYTIANLLIVPFAVPLYMHIQTSHRPYLDMAITYLGLLAMAILINAIVYVVTGND